MASCIISKIIKQISSNSAFSDIHVQQPAIASRTRLQFIEREREREKWMRTCKVCIDYRLCLQFIIKEKFNVVLINVIKALYTGCAREVPISRFRSYLLFQQRVLKLWVTIVEEPQTSSIRDRKVLKNM
jgi:hypothetical protein